MESIRIHIHDILEAEPLDIHGKSIGEITDVFLDAVSQEPIMIRVETGFILGKTRIVPLRGSSLTNRHLTLAIEKDAIDKAPDFKGDSLSKEERARIYEYYASYELANGHFETPLAPSNEDIERYRKVAIIKDIEASYF
ncbi:PRC-barrel domain-containing protein [Actinotignum urinale]|uniref:PRC-barrel domain-containing protein n=1 Tax=Actinotignum urinale TaxID=190146 RepID=A0AAW9HMP8_9ACTO|nr:PRC-barrel domain-containing protein [Actinotignum urinale]MDY5129103.1 PRC-barrel domain-containing protein [Actinotignum urinale]MDY5154921.1 PRC-barrel domain-containing protein [Actinotignum urinale]MDY5160824.1 PRC-barrel domain-containing protein [Actinotignum urinale]WIK59176.1 PRC-barrel domain-containing protein [Actinotignum urinale]